MKSKQQYGCWTCRLRRKKCDKARPACGVCKGLEITCHFEDQEPEWMTDGLKKARMLSYIKHEIKEKSAGRRERHQLRARHVNNPSQIVFSSAPGDDLVSRVTVEVQEAADSCLDSETTVGGRHGIQPGASRQSWGSSEPLGHRLQLPHGNGWTTSHPQEAVVEVDSIAKYLDYVFPFLFPFYRPAIFETGRSWILAVFKESRIARHAILGLTSLFFATALTNAYGHSYDDEAGGIRNQADTQHSLCLEGMRRDLGELPSLGTTVSALEKAHTMSDLVHMLLFESVMSTSSDWMLHLSAAAGLARGLLASESIRGSRMLSALLSLGPTVWYKVENDSYIWSSDQAGFRFCLAWLVFADIVASTALVEEPRLRIMYADILGEDDGAPILGFTRLRLSAVVGCTNDVLIAIADIANLALRKRICNETICTIDQTKETEMIVERLEKACRAIHNADKEDTRESKLHLSFQPFPVRAKARSICTTSTQIWIYAARIYLQSVVGEFDTQPTLDQCISNVLDLLEVTPSAHFRSLSWPICVAGCFANAGQQQKFRHMFAGKTALELIGSLRDAQQIMEKVWTFRCSKSGAPLDLASCFKTLGRPALLI